VRGPRLNGSPLFARAEQLRREFDGTFARAVREGEAPREDLLAVRVAGDPYALRLTECAGLYADRKVTRLPTPMADLIGLAAFRGVLVPVYDLRGLLGYPRTTETPRWMVAAAGNAVALAFEGFEAHVRVEGGSLAAEPAGRRHAAAIVRLAGHARPLLSVPSLLEAIASGADVRSKET